MCRAEYNTQSEPQRYNRNVRLLEEAESDDSEDDEHFIGAVSSKETQNDIWKVNLSMNGEMKTFTIDTGADVSVLPEHDIPEDVGMSKTNKKLFGPGNKPIEVMGKFKANLKRGSKETEQDIYVVRDLKEPLLGKKAIEELNQTY